MGSGRERRRDRGQTNLVSVALVVAITVALDGSAFFLVTTFEPPEPEDAIPDRGPSPLAPERVGGTLVGDAAERTLYDSSRGSALDGDPDELVGPPAPPVEAEVARELSRLKDAPPLPGFGADDELRMPSGDYYVESSNVWWGFGDERVVFDTTDGPVRVGIDGAWNARLSAVEGSHPVEVYVDRSYGSYYDDLHLSNATLDTDGRTDAFRVYARRDEGASEPTSLSSPVPSSGASSTRRAPTSRCATVSCTAPPWRARRV